MTCACHIRTLISRPCHSWSAPGKFLLIECWSDADTERYSLAGTWTLRSAELRAPSVEDQDGMLHGPAE